MARYITGIFILLLANIMPLQAQRKEPEVKTCERQIEKLRKAPDNITFARELHRTALYCFNRGMYDEAALLASLTVPFNVQAKDSIGKLLLPALIQSFSFKEEDMDYSNSLSEDSYNAYARLANAYTLVAESMMHNAHLRGHVEQMLKSALSLYRFADAKYNKAKAYTLQGDYYYQEKRYADAIKSFRKAAELGEKAFMEFELEELKNRWIMALIQHGKYKDAEKVLGEIRETDTPTRTITGLKDALCSRACIAIMKKDYATAEALHKEAGRRYHESMNSMDFYRLNVLRNFFDSFTLVARCYERQNEIGHSLQTYREMKECLINTLGLYIPYYIDLDRTNMLNLFQPWYDEMQTFAYRHISHGGMAEFMYSNAQLMKQFFLVSPTIYNPKMISMQGDEYLRELSRRQSKLMLTEDAMNVHLKGDYLPHILSNMRSMALSREAVTYVLENVDKPYHCITEWESVRKIIAADAEVMVEFVLIHRPDNGARQYAALVFTEVDKAPHFVPLCDEEPLRTALNDTDHDRRNDFILKNIWKPIQAHFGERAVISLYPTGLLSTVPLAGIVDDNNAYLCNDYVLSFYLCATDRLMKKYHLYPEKKPAVLFGAADYGLPPSKLENPVRGQGFHYLPSSKREITSVSALLKEKGCQVEVFSGRQATETAFRDLSARKESPFILHISTHGFYLPYDPDIKNKGLNQEGKSGYYNPLLRTGLALSGASTAWKDSASLNLPDDGLLTAYEIFGMSLLNTELVVLSACNTGLGEIRDGEGVYGLQRAFRSAGARNMIMTLAEVPDKETAEFMSLFYQNWKLKTSKRKAFITAQWEMVKRYPKEPEKWAYFVLVE